MTVRRPVVLNAMTVDVEDYFHVSALADVIRRDDWDRLESRVAANTDRVLRLFDDHFVTATFFVLGWVAERCPDLVRRIAGLGHEIASHGYAHQLIFDQTRDAFRDDVRRAKGLLEDIVGRTVHGYRAPSYSITNQTLWALDVIREEGHTYDASIFPVRHDRYGIPSAPRHAYFIARPAGALVEVPPSTVRMAGVNLPVAGGGYFRILPYEWTRRGIRRINRRERKPAVFYLHPWEIDAGQPRFRAGALSRFRHYRNLGRTEARLKRLFEDFSFGPIEAVIADVRRPHITAPPPVSDHLAAVGGNVW